MSNQLTSIKTTINNSINGVLFSDIKAEIGHSIEFLKQEAFRKENLNRIHRINEALIIEAFNDATEDYQKRAIIELAEDLGHQELAIELMSI